MENQEDKIEISWIPLGKYYDEWSFLGVDEARRVAEQIGSIDYLMDIKKNLPSYELIRKFHERVILISLGSLFEYGLKKATQKSLQKAKENEQIINTLKLEKEERRLNEEGMELTINRLYEINLLDEEWKEFLNRVRMLRDEVHMDRSRDENIQKWLEEIGLPGIKDKIDSFRNLIENIFNN